MGMKEKRIIGKVIYHVLVCGIGLIMIYPLVWMVMSSFKKTETIFTTAGQLFPTPFVLENYANGWKGFAKITFATFFKNSLFVSIIATIGTLISSALVAYGLSRCKFLGRRVLFVAMLLSMMLPAQVLMIPQYLWYQKLGWVGSFKPLIIPYFFAIQGFFVYQIMNFIDGIPRELDEAAKIDGCSYYGIFGRVILPLISPALITCTIFSFMWRSGGGHQHIRAERVTGSALVRTHLSLPEEDSEKITKKQALLLYRQQACFLLSRSICDKLKEGFNY